MVPFGLVLGISLGFTDYAQCQISNMFAIGQSSPSNESSPGGIPIFNSSISAIEYVIPASTFDHPIGLPDKYDRSIVWLGEDGEILNSKLYARPTKEYMAWIDTAYQNKLAFAGTLGGTANDDISLMLTSQDGVPVWSKKTGSANLSEKGVCVKADDAGTLLFLGNQETSVSQHSVVAIRVDASGNNLWSRVYTLSGWTMEASSVTALSCPMLLYYITGTMTQISGGTSRAFLLIIDGNGFPNRMKYYNIVQNNGSDAGTCIQAKCDPRPQIWISGYSYNPITSKNMVMMLRTDDEGNLVWGYNYDFENGDEFARHFIIKPSGELIVTGKAECHEFGTGEYPGYCMLTSIAPDGFSINWVRTYRWTPDYLRWSQGNRVERRPSSGEGGYFISGETNLGGDKDVLAILTQPNGQLSETCYHDTSAVVISNGANSISIDVSNIIINSLEFYDNSPLSIGTFNEDQLQCDEEVATEDPDINDSLPLKIYPNPATDKISIEWTGDASLDGQVIITTSTGKVVRTLALNGTNRMEIDMGQLPSGLYFLKIQSEDQTFKATKLLLFK